MPTKTKDEMTESEDKKYQILIREEANSMRIEILDKLESLQRKQEKCVEEIEFLKSRLSRLNTIYEINQAVVQLKFPEILETENGRKK